MREGKVTPQAFLEEAKRSLPFGNAGVDEIFRDMTRLPPIRECGGLDPVVYYPLIDQTLETVRHEGQTSLSAILSFAITGLELKINILQGNGNRAEIEDLNVTLGVLGKMQDYLAGKRRRKRY